MLVIYYILFVFLALIFLKQMYSFLRYFYSQPLLTNTYAEFIPSRKIIEDYIIENKNGSFSCVIEIKGYAYFRSEDLDKSNADNLAIKERALNFKGLKENIHIKFLFKRFKVKDGYQNRNLIEITSDNKIVLKENSNRLLNGLNEFKPYFLKNQELLDFLFLNANFVDKSLKQDNVIGIDDICSYSSVDFESTHGELSNFDAKKYFKCFSFNFGSEIDSQYFNKIVTADIEFDYIINSKFFSKLKGQKELSNDKKNITASADASSSGKIGVLDSFLRVSNKKITEVQEAQEIIDNEDANLTVSDIFMIVFADSEEDLLLLTVKIKEIISKYEIFLVEETKLLNFFFLSRLIGFKLHNTMKFLIPYADSLVYAKKVLSSTIAGLSDFIDMPKGLSKCDWGVNPISSFSTNYNNLYRFYTHVSEEKAAVGHGVIVAPTGGGKTTFIQYLMKGILKNYNDVDVYSFDRFNGISVFTNWIGGKDINFLELAINPLQVDLEREDNKDFLNNFLSMIAKPEIPEDKEILKDFVNAISLLPKEHRILKELIENDTLPPCNIRDNLDIWVNGNYAKYINAKEDKFSLDSSMLNFQMDKILDDEELSAPIIYYIMFKIRQKARKSSRGHFVFIDESAKMVKNPYFQSQIEVLLQEHRKLRGCVWLAFQNPNAFLEEKKLRELVLNQCQNQLIFSSSAINDEVLNNLSINSSIYNELIETQKSNQNPYFVLLKRPNENVILNVNLKEKLGSDLKFLSSSVEDVNKMNKLMAEHGDRWYEYY